MTTTTIGTMAWQAPRRDGVLSRVAACLHAWHARARERRRLASLDARMLDDIGLSREQALTESRRPFWE